MFAITILGNNSATPTELRNPTAQVLQWQDESYLIDCGEGTQKQMVLYKIKRSKISRVFISHLHGDHYFGLIGLITSLGLQGRIQPLYIHAPAALEAIIQLQLEVANVQLPYPLHFCPLQHEGPIVEDNKIMVSAFKVRHRIECWGFLFRQKKHPRKILPEAARLHHIPAAFYEKLQQGLDYTAKDGVVVANAAVTTEAPVAKSYAYCADTIFDESLAQKVKGVSLLYHEATYLHDLADKAASRYHSTTVQAATIARLAGVDRLIIGHFSAKYDELDAFLEEAMAVFKPTELALEGVCYLT
jgi:ribonuclease Z